MSHRTQAVFLTAILAATCVVQAAAIARAVVPSLDAVRFVNTARAIDQSGLLVALRDRIDPPLFPIVVWTTHSALVALVGDFREAWAFSVQLAAAIPLVLLPVPVFLLARRLVGPQVALLGTVLFMALPELVRLGADGLSDSTHLLWLSTAFALLGSHLEPIRKLSHMRAVSARGRHILWFSDRFLVPDARPGSRIGSAFLAGGATALAVLTRSEALLVPVAFGAVVLGRAVQCRQMPWRSVLPYAAGLLLILAPRTATLALPSGQAAASPVLSRGPDLTLPNGESPSFASKDPSKSIRRRGVAGAVAQLAQELPKTFGYLPGILALVGLAVLLRRPVTETDVLLRVFSSLFLAAVFFHTAREGYLAARHLLPLAVAGTACLGVGVQVVADWSVGTGVQRIWAGRMRWGFGLALVLAVGYTCYAVRPLHQSRAGHRAAAEWLARHGRVDDRVVDTRGWTGLYSGLLTIPYGDARSEFLQSQLRYVVVEDSELAHDSRRSRTIRRLLETGGTLAASFPVRAAGSGSPPSVLVYQWDRVDPSMEGRGQDVAGEKLDEAGSADPLSSSSPIRLASTGLKNVFHAESR